MTDKAALTAARNAGRTAEPGAENPHKGQGALARMWRLGYDAMLLDMLNNSPARQKFLRGNQDSS